MKKSIELELCDVCVFDPARIVALTALRKCEVCERSLCNDSVHVADSYNSTAHMRRPFSRYVCTDCWELATSNVGYNNGTHPLPTGQIDLRASGQSGAINIAEFREWVASSLDDMANQAVIDVIREIKNGVDVKFNKAKAIRELKAKHEAELEAVKSTVRNQFI